MKKKHFAFTLTFLTACFLYSGCSYTSIPPVTAIEETRKTAAEKSATKKILQQSKRYSWGKEEIVIRDFFQDKRDQFFVDIGCAWPVMFNNTYFLEKHLGWSGIGVDALNDYAAAWKEKRSRAKFLNYLVSAASEVKLDFYRSERKGNSSVNQWLADGSFFGSSYPNEKVHPPTISLNDLFDREGISTINLLSIDVEGHEIAVLAGLDLNRFAPELIVIEVLRPNQEIATRYLEQYGYHQIERYKTFDKINMYFSRTPRASND